MRRGGATRHPVARRTIAASIAAALATLGLALASPQAKSSPARKKTEQEVDASLQAHRGDFDYLLGDWEFTAVRKMPTPSSTAGSSSAPTRAPA
jgi:hypothetical protein